MYNFVANHHSKYQIFHKYRKSSLLKVGLWMSTKAKEDYIYPCFKLYHNHKQLNNDIVLKKYKFCVFPKLPN